MLTKLSPILRLPALSGDVERETRKRPKAMRLMTHPGVGAALAFGLIIGTPTRFQRGNQIGTYVGMIPCEESSARAAATWTHQQARQLFVVFTVVGSGPSVSTCPS